MAARVGKLMDLGVSIIGGCCGTTPAHIRAIRAAMDSHRGPDGE
jgi:5-methyltetrahydrofolate--homocysteine methyltransferase